jgi:hypothetical protein
VNAERLHAIVRALRDEITATSYPDHLEELRAGLAAISESPNQPEPQQRVSSAREGLNNVLRDSPANDFSPVWRQALEEMGVADLVGDALLERIEAVLLVNDITPATAASEVGEIASKVNEMVAALSQADDSLNFFKIRSEDLMPGEFEIGVMIPRRAVGNGLEALGKEFVDLKKIIATFSELAGENRPEVEVRSISSSEFQVFLDSAPVVAAMVATTLERLMKAYESFLNIRKLHREMAEAGIPEENLEGVSGYVSGTMGESIRQIVEEALAEARIDDEGRINELRKDLNIRVSELAERIDNGFDVEVRAGELPDPTEGEEDEETLDPETMAATEKVLDAQKSLEFMNVEGKAILHLDPPNEPAAGDEPSDGPKPS